MKWLLRNTYGILRRNSAKLFLIIFVFCWITLVKHGETIFRHSGIRADWGVNKEIAHEESKLEQEPEPEMSPQTEAPKPLESKPTTVSKPQDPNKKLLIISYQRCGSTFFGGIFGNHPDVAYVYEPLDGVFVSLYGTLEGWNTPTDIVFYSNGTTRPLPRHEVEAITDTLDNLLNCRIASVPVEVLAHKFWKLFQGEFKSLKYFARCTPSTPSLTTCRMSIAKACEHRYYSDREQQNMKCYHGIRNSDDRSDNFDKYRSCLEKIRKKVAACVKKTYGPKCNKTTFRAVKTVRATMPSIEELLERNPNLKIIHLLRDPRAVMLSRTKFDPSSFSLYSTVENHTKRTLDVSKEAHVFCNNALNDVLLRRKMATRHPDAFLEVIYDDFIRDPVENAKDIFEFIGVEFKTESRAWLEKNSIKHGQEKWLHELTDEEIHSINEQCQAFYKTVPYSWNKV